MEIEKLKYDHNYLGALNARVNWIAGGNFDGYIYRVHLRFLKENNKVIKTIKIVDDSRYDDKAYDKDVHGTFSETDKGTISCKFENFEMRGKILGGKNEFIVFSVLSTGNNEEMTECYEI
ncbi:hypothetical protein NZ698_08250 [Chryseobacterium sp. PBS4-4]|uniref:Uncharacterized protein n=1 Tax=Chryseobacterium edaphi TaxID=2976532 RepID=A0ABT2W4P4_9FLAO|nr:hypothetical protein [Chryseobacterium edaphi]MCU7617186.1 hypothetical protein [Chryseobacterium edaphi]